MKEASGIGPSGRSSLPPKTARACSTQKTTKVIQSFLGEGKHASGQASDSAALALRVQPNEVGTACAA